MAWIIDKIRDILPNRPYGKTAKDTRMARLIDLNKVIEDVNQGFENNIPYKVYTALLIQNGITEPEAFVLENTLEVNATYFYDNVGEYSITFDKSLFNSPFEYVTISQNSYVNGANNICNINAVPVFFNAISIISYEDLTPSDDVIGDIYPCLIEIRVYNDSPIIPFP
jgi:hypothetical protein